MSSFIQQAPEAIGVLEHDFAFAPGPQERPDSCAIRAQQCGKNRERACTGCN